MRCLIVGDPHATVEELDDCQRLLDYICKVADEQKVDLVVFLGDLYHNHAIMHVEVMAFWTRAFAQIRSKPQRCETMVLVGNHDMPGDDSSTSHALMAQQACLEVTIVEKPFRHEGVLFLPYYSNHEAFIKACQDHSDCPTVVCHQTFNDALFENGFAAKDGLDSNLLPQEAVLSGHIHAPQSFGKVWYPGAPRWRTLSDANTDRAIWVVDFENGRIKSKQAFSTRGVCKEIRRTTLTVSPTGAVFDPRVELLDLGDGQLCLDPRVDWRIDIKGPAEYVEQWKNTFSKQPNLRLRTFVTDSRPVQVRESEGIQQAFTRFCASFTAKNGTSVEALQKMADERLKWM